jgi:hypothetical protein
MRKHNTYFLLISALSADRSYWNANFAVPGFAVPGPIAGAGLPGMASGGCANGVASIWRLYGVGPKDPS